MPIAIHITDYADYDRGVLGCERYGGIGRTLNDLARLADGHRKSPGHTRQALKGQGGDMLVTGLGGRRSFGHRHDTVAAGLMGHNPKRRWHLAVVDRVQLQLICRIGDGNLDGVDGCTA